MSKEPEIRVKFEIGDIKFEAEGSADLVERERSIFNTQLLPAAVDAIMRTRPLVSVDSYTDISEQQRETSSNTVDNLPTSKITPSLPAPNDFSRVSLASFAKSKGADSHYDFILCAVYYNEQKNIREDNLMNKIKAVVLKILMNFINQKLKEIYGNKGVGRGINSKRLYRINSEQTSNTKIDYNQNFIYKTLKDIYSEDISTRKKDMPADKNKILIDYLLTKEKNLEIKGYFQNLFNLRFIECVRHFVSQSKEDENYKMELDGLKLFNDLIKNDPSKLNIKEEDMNDEVYLAYYDNFIKKKKKIIMGKKARKRVPKKNNKCQSKK